MVIRTQKSTQIGEWVVLTSRPFSKLWPTDQPTKQHTDMGVNGSVNLLNNYGKFEIASVVFPWFCRDYGELGGKADKARSIQWRLEFIFIENLSYYFYSYSI